MLYYDFIPIVLVRSPPSLSSCATTHHVIFVCAFISHYVRSIVQYYTVDTKLPSLFVGG